MCAETNCEAVLDESAVPAVRGFLHRPGHPSGAGLALTHGAGGNCQMLLLRALAEEFAGQGWFVLRCDLPFRQMRAYGPPSPASAARDRDGLRRALEVLGKQASGPLYLGGHSYGGRQASMLAAEEPQIARALLLTSYPLHPPGKPAQLRVQHFPQLRIPALFVIGTRDPFATVEELEAARKLIPSPTLVEVAEGAGHDLGYGRKAAQPDLPARIVQVFCAITRESASMAS
ncbi:MAG TPA: alpha/beta family hydrolase [Terriglobales bacterium]|nr:alpha/beta family hydrolase [Terriglobales bacterium]